MKGIFVTATCRHDRFRQNALAISPKRTVCLFRRGIQEILKQLQLSAMFTMVKPNISLDEFRRYFVGYCPCEIFITRKFPHLKSFLQPRKLLKDCLRSNTLQNLYNFTWGILRQWRKKNIKMVILDSHRINHSYCSVGYWALILIKGG